MSNCVLERLTENGVEGPPRGADRGRCLAEHSGRRIPIGVRYGSPDHSRHHDNTSSPMPSHFSACSHSASCGFGGRPVSLVV